MVGEPSIVTFEARPYVGIRTIAPFNSMFAERDTLLKELRRWEKDHAIAERGPYFLRYHVIDMEGNMDITVGFLVPHPLAGNERIVAGEFPAGTYATLTYRRYGLRANKALLAWISEQGIELDRWNDPAGDAFGCRYEAYLTDIRVEPRRSKWEVALAMRICDQ